MLTSKVTGITNITLIPQLSPFQVYVMSLNEVLRNINAKVSHVTLTDLSVMISEKGFIYCSLLYQRGSSKLSVVWTVLQQHQS